MCHLRHIPMLCGKDNHQIPFLKQLRISFSGYRSLPQYIFHHYEAMSHCFFVLFCFVFDKVCGVAQAVLGLAISYR